MRAEALFLALLSGIGCALIVKAPTPTITATTRVLSSSIRAAEVTEAPAVHPDLLRRDINNVTRTAFLAQTNICGYLNGASSAAIGCNVGYVATCGLFVDNTLGASASEGAMGCCYPSTQGQSTSNCAVFTTCMDYSMLTVNSCANLCGPNENTLQCTASDTPYCSSFTFSNVFTDAAPGVKFTGYICAGVKGDIGQGAYTTYVGQNAPMNFSTTTVLFLETLSGNVTSSSTSLLSSSSTPLSSTSLSSPPVSSTTTSSSPTSSSSAASSTTVSAGPIVGGVLGGVTALVAAAAGIYFWRRKRRDPVVAEQPGGGAHSAQDYNTHLPTQGLNGTELAQKVQVAEVAGDHGVHEIMGSEVYR